MNDFKKFKFHKDLEEILDKLNFETPTEIQEKAIQPIIDRKDLIGIAQTGTGKTLAFSLPIIDLIAKNRVKMKPARVRALIITPTRELASQIHKSIKDLSKRIKLFPHIVYGGVGKRPQLDGLVKGVDILVATPGRLLDFMDEGHVLFENLEYFVLDEADRMLSMGFIEDVKKIISSLPEKRQNLMFTATMDDKIEKLATSFMNDPEKINASPVLIPLEQIKQKILKVDYTNKLPLLKHVLNSTKGSTIVFTQSKDKANRVERYLEKESISAVAIHSDKNQGAREKALGRFRVGKIRVLVATDIVARGIDISDITCVINFELPFEIENYVHRIGRTGRAGKSGEAISFCCEKEEILLQKIEEFVGFSIDVDKSHPFQDAEKNAGRQNLKQKFKRGKN